MEKIWERKGGGEGNREEEKEKSLMEKYDKEKKKFETKDSTLEEEAKELSKREESAIAKEEWENWKKDVEEWKKGMSVAEKNKKNRRKKWVRKWRKQDGKNKTREYGKS